MKKVFIAMLLVFALVGGTHATDLTELFVNVVPITGSSNSQIVTGKVFYVGDSYNGVTGVDAGPSGASVSSPYATLDYAINASTASRGDVIYLLPGHSETITSATTIALDVAGVKVIGLGTGSAMATITYTTSTAATLPISADNVHLENILFVMGANGGADAMSAMATVTGSDVTFKNCEFRQGNSTAQAERAIYITDGADRINVIGCKIWTETTTGAIASVDFYNTGTQSSDYNVIAENRIFGDFSSAPVYSAYTGTVNSVINNEITNYNAGDFAAMTWRSGYCLRPLACNNMRDFLRTKKKRRKKK